MGGKLGDFLHAMFAVKQLCLKNNCKANVYMYDIGWEFGINNTYKELQPILESQPYISSLNVLSDYEINPIQTPENNTPIVIKDSRFLEEGYVDLGRYVASPWLYKTCWSQIYSNTFDFTIQGDYQWIQYDKVDNSLKDKVLIHRRNNPIRINYQFPYEQILEEYGDRVLFISGNESDYQAFQYRDKLPFLKVSTLDDWFTSINSCAVLISNLSSPAVIGHSLDKLRIIELPNILDAAHCVGEERYSANVFWYIDDKFNNLM